MKEVIKVSTFELYNFRTIQILFKFACFHSMSPFFIRLSRLH